MESNASKERDKLTPQGSWNIRTGERIRGTRDTKTKELTLAVFPGNLFFFEKSVILGVSADLGVPRTHRPAVL
jgi:hypothetical protein